MNKGAVIILSVVGLSVIGISIYFLTQKTTNIIVTGKQSTGSNASTSKGSGVDWSKLGSSIANLGGSLSKINWGSGSSENTSSDIQATNDTSDETYVAAHGKTIWN